MTHLFSLILVGIGATLIMDGWGLFLRHAFQVNSLNFCLVGRWLSHMSLGQFRHNNIAAASKRPAECLLGWSAHYLLGVAFALLLLPIADTWLAQPLLMPALTLGVVTVLVPFFLMQPALGFGIAAAKTPQPGKARLKSLATHAVFGCGLYLSALLLRYLSN